MSTVPIYLLRSRRLVLARSQLNLAQVRTNFYNKYKHGPTKTSNPKPDYAKWTTELFKPEGVKFFKEEMRRVINKNIEKTNFPRMDRVGEIHFFEKFDSEERIKLWKPVADSDSNNGYSISTFSRSPNGYGLFKGILDNRLPEDGLTQKSGFAAAIGPRKKSDKLFDMNPSWNWFDHNTVHIKYRGDGRKYNFVVNVGRYDNDMLGYDVYSYPLHTRGGPYWQTIAIPFNRMIFAYKNAIQNAQYKMPSDVKFVAFTLSDTYDGPFNLEIASIGLSLEWRPTMRHPMYELYSHPHIKFKQVNIGCDPPDD